MASDSHFNLFDKNEESAPPLPTREQELAYLDQLEQDFRAYGNQNIAPDPTREFNVKYARELDEFDRQHRRKWLLGLVLSAPLAVWLTRRSTYHQYGGIPKRKYPELHYVRFWSHFALYSLGLASAFTFFTTDMTYPKAHEFYLYDTRKRHL